MPRILPSGWARPNPFVHTHTQQFVSSQRATTIFWRRDLLCNKLFHMRETRPDTSNEAIGARLVAVRTARDWTQAMMSQQLDVSYQRLGQWERGLRTIPPNIIGRVWQLTGATADYILLGRMDGLPHELALALRRAEKANSATG